MATKIKVAKQASPEEVLQAYRAAVTQNPSDALAQCNLGWGLHHAGMLEEAAVAFRRALDLDMNSLDAHYGLGLTYKKLGRAPEAKAEFERSMVLAGQAEDSNRGRMLKRLARGQINEMESGDWDLRGITTLRG